jgi:hypothetical protein
MTQERRDKEQQEFEVTQLSNGEVEKQLNALVDAWRQLSYATAQLQDYEANTTPPVVPDNVFDSTENFIEYNQQRRELLRGREDLVRYRDARWEDFNQAAEVVLRVLLPEGHVLMHKYEGSEYSIRNKLGQIEVALRSHPVAGPLP